MVPASPADALGPRAADVRPLVVETVRSLHDRFAEAHQISRSRYGLGFGGQWRDLLDDVREVLRDRGYRTHKLAPAGYELPVVNDCLVYVWRVPESADALSSFASSPTRKNGFKAPLLDPTLFEPDYMAGLEPSPDATFEEPASEQDEVEQVVRAVDDVMPLVLVMVHSSPLQLRAIEWAVAELDDESGRVMMRGHQSIWQPELSDDEPVANAEAFDSGIPTGVPIEPQKQEGTQSDA